MYHQDSALLQGDTSGMDAFQRVPGSTPYRGVFVSKVRYICVLFWSIAWNARRIFYDNNIFVLQWYLEQRLISIARLKPLRALYLRPINLIVSQESTKPYLGGSFALRCFQRLSPPNAATQRCPWQDNWYTGGSCISVLSY